MAGEATTRYNAQMESMTPPRSLTQQETADALGVSLPTVARMVKRGLDEPGSRYSLPSVLVTPGARRIPWEAVDAYRHGRDAWAAWDGSADTIPDTPPDTGGD